jgi:UDPglucose 6-dehydrogenase
MIGFIGLSHLGIVYGTATAAHGFDVLGFDPNAALCVELSNGHFPVAEPGLPELFAANRQRLRFTADASELSKCDVVFFSLDVPTDEANRSNLEPLRQLIEHTAPHLSPQATAVILCQVPPGFTRSLEASHATRGLRLGAQLFYQVETLIFGNAVERALKPERYMVGGGNPQAPLPEAYSRWLNAFGCPVLLMRYESAELAKIAINLFLVSSVTTTNTLAEVCERIGADWSEIAPALRLDKRIGPHAYLGPGLGIAGGNLERDLVTVQTLAAQHGTDAGVVAAWQRNSAYRRDWALRKIHELVLSRHENAWLAIWGLAYKPNTHSVKNSPSLALLAALHPFPKTAFDPQVKSIPVSLPRLHLADSALDACRGADALIIMTPWAEFSKIEPPQIKASLRGNVVIDPFGALNSAACAAAGLSHHSLGRRTETH